MSSALAGTVRFNIKNTFVSVEDRVPQAPELSRARTEPSRHDAILAGALMEVLSSSDAVCDPVDQIKEPSEGESLPQADTAELIRQLSAISTLQGLPASTSLPSVTASAPLEPPALPSPQAAPEAPEAAGGKREATTCMLRNLPSKYTQDMLIRELTEKGFGEMFDFFYSPIDFKNMCNVGYAFVNFVTHEAALQFFARFRGYRLPAFQSTKVCDVSWARVQGVEANVAHFRNSPVNAMEEAYRPRLFFEGKPVLFPRPDQATASARPRRTGARDTKKKIRARPLKLFLGGLPAAADESTLKDYMRHIVGDDVAEATVIREKGSGTSRGFGFVSFGSQESVRKVLELPHHAILGHHISVKEYAAPR